MEERSHGEVRGGQPELQSETPFSKKEKEKKEKKKGISMFQ